MNHGLSYLIKLLFPTKERMTEAKHLEALAPSPPKRGRGDKGGNAQLQNLARRALSQWHDIRDRL